MTALTQDRSTPARDARRFLHPVAAGAVIHAGALVALDAAGNAVPGATALNLTAVGRAEEAVDNTGGAAGEVRVAVERGCFAFANDGSITRAEIGKTAFILDDQTLAATDGGGTRSPAGIIRDLDAYGVWVEI